MNSLSKVIQRKGKRFLFKVETSGDHRDYLKYEELRNEIWDFRQDNLPGTRNMMCENFFYDGSSLFIAVYRESECGGFKHLDREHLVGFSYGFVGVKDKKIGFRSKDNLLFYSQYTGVKERFRTYGLGLLIKEFQREKVIELLGINTVTCTFDPLTGVNAYRNIHHFGMEVVAYRKDIYGDFGGLLNREDVPSDRFIMSWDLRKDIRSQERKLGSYLEEGKILTEVEFRELRGKSGIIELEVLKKINLDVLPEIVIVEIPFDFYLMLQETEVKEREVREIPLKWRMETREAFQKLLSQNYRVVDFTSSEFEGRRRNFYILEKR